MTLATAYPGIGQPLLLHSMGDPVRAGLSGMERLVMPFFKTILLAASLAAPAAAASTKPSLRDIPEIENPLFAIVVAYVIGEECPTIVAREVKGIWQLQKLYNRARALGYSHEEIRAYVKSPVEKARMKAKGMQLLKKYGPADDPQSYCAFGQAELAKKNSAIGALLKAK